MNLDKTEVVWVGKQGQEINIRLERKDIKQVKEICVSGWKYILERASGGGGATQNTSRSECMEKS